MAEREHARGKLLRTRLRLFFTIVPGVFLLDLLTKKLVQGRMTPYGETVELIEGLARLRFIYNEGIVFGISPGFLSGWLLIGVSAAVAAVIIGYIFFSDYDDRLGIAGLCLIAGGALGNLLDRTLYGRVVDFIEIGINDLTWPVFNVADIAVTAGAVILAFRLMFYSPEHTDSEGQAAAAGNRTAESGRNEQGQ